MATVTTSCNSCPTYHLGVFLHFSEEVTLQIKNVTAVFSDSVLLDMEMIITKQP